MNGTRHFINALVPTDLFKGLGDEGQARLHAFLEHNSFCTILATAQSLFDAVTQKHSSFHDFFLIHQIPEFP